MIRFSHLRGRTYLTNLIGRAELHRSSGRASVDTGFTGVQWRRRGALNDAPGRPAGTATLHRRLHAMPGPPAAAVAETRPAWSVAEPLRTRLDNVSDHSPT